MSSEEPWFAVRCIFNCGVSRENPPRTRYEERIVLVLAESAEEAIARAEKEAAEYAALNGFTITDDFIDCYHTFLSGPPGDLSEVFSLMRDWDLPDREYIDEFFDTGWENRSPPHDPASGPPPLL